MKKTPDPYDSLWADVRVLQSQMEDFRAYMDQRLVGQDKNVSLALTAADKTTAIAQQTADRAVVKAEAAASREYLEAQIEALRNVTKANMESQKEAITAALTASEKAITAALTAAQQALTAALASSEKAISKAEDANEKRFQSVNEFRQTLADQQAGFATKSEVTLRFNAVEDKLQTALTTLSETRGKSQGANWMWGIFVGVVGILLTIVSVTAVVLTR